MTSFIEFRNPNDMDKDDTEWTPSNGYRRGSWETKAERREKLRKMRQRRKERQQQQRQHTTATTTTTTTMLINYEQPGPAVEQPKRKRGRPRKNATHVDVHDCDDVDYKPYSSVSIYFDKLRIVPYQDQSSNGNGDGTTATAVVTATLAAGNLPSSPDNLVEINLRAIHLCLPGDRAAFYVPPNELHFVFREIVYVLDIQDPSIRSIHDLNRMNYQVNRQSVLLKNRQTERNESFFETHLAGYTYHDAIQFGRPYTIDQYKEAYSDKLTVEVDQLIWPGGEEVVPGSSSSNNNSNIAKTDSSQNVLVLD